MQFIREIKDFIIRGKYGWCSSDTWNFDGYLARIIKEGLIHLKENKHGYPSELAEEQWNVILGKMIRTFDMAEKIIDDELDYLPIEKWDPKEIRRKEKFAEEMREKYGSTCRVMTREESRQLTEGWILLQKYFFSLWD